MSRSSFASGLFALLTSAGLYACGPAQHNGQCDQANAPAECGATCDPTPGADSGCSAGFHCTTGGTCDSDCTPGGTDCTSGDVCTPDGRCVPGANSDAGPLIDADCPAVHFTATSIIPSIELLIDRSGSMDGTDISPTRYKAITTGLVGAMGVVNDEQANVYFGAAMFSGDETPCLTIAGHTVPRALNNASAIKTLLNANENQPAGNTPTAPAIDQVVADFAANPPPATSPPIILLATDGEPNSCTSGDINTADSIASAKAAYTAGIRLFILGLANLNTQFLQDMANAGAGVTAGMPDAPFYTANDPATLQASLQQIIGGVASCDLMLNGTVDTTTAMGGTVTLNGATLMYGTDWTLVNGSTLELLGTACDTLKTSTNPTVDASFPCGAVIF